MPNQVEFGIETTSGWTQVHKTGLRNGEWSIGKCLVGEKWHYVLWRGADIRGVFDSAQAAKEAAK